MKRDFNKIILILGVLCAINFTANAAQNKSLYGGDDRRFVAELEVTKSLNNDDQFLFESSKAILAMIPSYKLDTTELGSVFLKTDNLALGMNYCADEKFSESPMVSSCTGFLVGPDLLMTAGHCVESPSDCRNNVWVLDYLHEKNILDIFGKVDFSKDNIVKCEKIISVVNNNRFDYSLIKLDRKISDRKFLNIRKSGKIENSEPLAVIGHPYGLPKIVANNAYVRSNELPNRFITNTDTFSGNSGSPVFGLKSRVVEGILIKGEEDFVMDIDKGCNTSFKCNNNECRGETVQRIFGLPLPITL